MRNKICSFVLLALFSFMLAVPNAHAQTPKEGAQTTKTKSGTAKSKPKKLTEDEKKALYEASVHKMLSAIYNNQFASALTFCKDAMQLDSNDNIMFKCVGLYDKNNDPQSALDLVIKIRNRTSANKQNFEYCFSQGTLYTKLHLYNDALATYRSCVPPTDYSKAVIMGNSAELEMVTEEPDKAILSYEQALEIQPDNSHAIFGLSVALIRAGRSQEAYDTFLRGIKVDPYLMFLYSSFFEPKAEEYFHKAVLSLFSHRVFDAKFYLEECLKHEVRVKYREITKALLADIEAGVYSKADYKAYPIVLQTISMAAIDDQARFLAFADNEKHELWVIDTESGKCTKRVQDIVDIRALQFIAQTGVLRVVAKDMRVELDPDGSGYTYYNTLKDEARWIGLTNEGDLLGTQEDGIIVAPFRAPLDTKVLYAISKMSTDNSEQDALSDNVKEPENKTFPKYRFVSALLNNKVSYDFSNIKQTDDREIHSDKEFIDNSIQASLSNDGETLYLRGPLEVERVELEQTFKLNIKDNKDDKDPGVLRLSSGEQLLLGYPSVSFSQGVMPNGVVLSSVNGVVVYNQQKQPIARIGPVARLGEIQNQGMGSVAVSPNGKFLLTVNGTLAEIWNLDAL